MKLGLALDHQDLLGIPVSTLPVLRIPFHFSYQLDLATHCSSFMRMYVRASLAICRLAGSHPSHLMQPLDFLGRADVPKLEFFPSMNLEPLQ